MLKEVDFRAIDEWVQTEDKVLDLDAAEVLEHLREQGCSGLELIGNFVAISCVSRKVPVYQEEILTALSKFNDNLRLGYFSRMVETLPEPYLYFKRST